MCDYDYGTRLRLLADLMHRSPNKPVRKLQREALKYYPLSGKEAIRNWMKIATAFDAAEVLNRRLGLYDWEPKPK